MISDRLLQLTDGLELFEVVLLALGVFLFFVCCVAVLIRSFRKAGGYTGIVMLLLVALVMIGYPSIQSVEFGEFKLTKLTQATQELAANPTDVDKQEEVKRLIESAPQATIRSTKNRVVLADGYEALSRSLKAQATQKPLEATKLNLEASRYQKRMSTLKLKR